MIIVAQDVSSGITKFSGFSPLRKVKIAIPSDTKTMPATAMKLDKQITTMMSTKPVTEATRFAANDISAKTRKIRKEASQALVMFLA